jgi:hypothetical protein
MPLICPRCEELIQDYWSINAELKKVAREAVKLLRCREMKLFHKPWRRWLELSQESNKVRHLFLAHLQSHKKPKSFERGRYVQKSGRKNTKAANRRLLNV